MNRSLATEDEVLRGAQIRKFLILHKELDPDDEEITRTRKVRRGYIAEKYAPLIEALYGDRDRVTVEARVTDEDGRTGTIRADVAIRECPSRRRRPPAPCWRSTASASASERFSPSTASASRSRGARSPPSSPFDWVVRASARGSPAPSARSSRRRRSGARPPVPTEQASCNDDWSDRCRARVRRKCLGRCASIASRASCTRPTHRRTGSSPSRSSVPRTPTTFTLRSSSAASSAISITPRGAGTSFTGQCVGEGLNVDCSLLDAIEWIDDRAQDRARAAGGAMVDAQRTGREGRSALRPRSRHAPAMHGRRDDRDELRRHALDRLRRDGRSRARDRRRPRRRTIGSRSKRTAACRPTSRTRLDAVRDRATPLLGPAFSTLARRGGGYQLEHLCTDHPHMAKFLAGSEGTLALMTAVEVTLDRLPSHRVLAVVAFDDLHAAIATVPALVATRPCAVEVVSKSMIDIARGDAFHAKAVADDRSRRPARCCSSSTTGGRPTRREPASPRMDRVLAGAPACGRATGSSTRRAGAHVGGA